MANMIITAEYGYPLIKMIDDQGNQEWYYPETPDEWSPGKIPTLIKGWPSISVTDQYQVNIFTPDVDGFVMPVVLAIKIRPSRPGGDMDIEERAQKWADEYATVTVDAPPYTVKRLAIEAYLAGVEQARKDYIKY